VGVEPNQHDRKKAWLSIKNLILAGDFNSYVQKRDSSSGERSGGGEKRRRGGEGEGGRGVGKRPNRKGIAGDNNKLSDSALLRV
jgi:hypothetical protein